MLMQCNVIVIMTQYDQPEVILVDFTLKDFRNYKFKVAICTFYTSV